MIRVMSSTGQTSQYFASQSPQTRIELSHILWGIAKRVNLIDAYLGEGAHREVYDLGNGWVVKYAREVEQNYEEVDTWDALCSDHLARVEFEQELLNMGVVFMEYVEPIEDNFCLPESEDYASLSNTLTYNSIIDLDEGEIALLDEQFAATFNTIKGSFIAFMDWVNGCGLRDVHIGNIGVKDRRVVALDYNYGYL